MSDQKEDVQYAPIRSLARGLEVLQTINREGSLTLTRICRITGLPYPTVFRIMQTLISVGFVECEPARKWYRPTLLAKTLSSGFPEESRLVAVSRPYIVELTEKFAWPISITTRVGNMMMVRDSTHSLTSLTLSNYAPGYTLPLAECSTGKAYLAFCSEEERRSIRKGFGLLENPTDRIGAMLMDSESLFEEIRANGYAIQARNAYTSNPGKTSSIAVPIVADGTVFGAMAIIFFTVGVKMEKAVEAFVGDLKQSADRIAADMVA
ncbi:transcriptional regulator [Erythrobacter sp. Dej080120_24]|uniref:helix-turn-helix domain-containing protein n=1 Tax=Erythrobacter sp. Dej080120_24 TaxID=3024837 RepID=UPI0029260635|nr:transcriptional regulator [Erythrobacter sp. Dej080120_24]